MFLIKALLLWTVVSVHIVGAAFCFRRLFPRESVWLGFVVPEILVLLGCNFVEHHVALTHLQILLPFTTVAAVGSILWRNCPWRVMRLPTLLFLSAFAFTFLLRLLRPGLEDSRDGVSDLSVIANFLFGQTLPAESTWLPPFKMEGYYCLEHYGASLLIRLLGLDIGTGFNLCAALLSAYLALLGGAIAWHLSRGKLWIVVLMTILMACAANGDAGYLWLTVPHLEPDNVIDPYSLLDATPPPANWFLRHLSPINLYEQHLLMPPGYGAWMGCFHSAQTGQLVLSLSTLSLIEAVRRRRTNWPWITLLISPLLMLTTCTWGLPLVLFMMAGGFIICFRMKIIPASPLGVGVVFAGVAILLEPMLTYFLDARCVQIFAWATGLHTQVPEFLAQWWPIFLPWLLLLFIWNRLHPVTRIIVILTPLAFASAEVCNLGIRADTTSKFWGLVYAAAWITFLPEIARQKTWPFRTVLMLIAVNGALALGFWTTYYAHHLNPSDLGRLNGLGPLQSDRRKARILETVSQLHDQVIISGETDWAYTESSLVPILSHNRAYAAWSNFCDSVLYANAIDEGARREVIVNQLYDGKNPNPLVFLRQRNIAALVIYPDDNVDPKVVDQLKQSLAPYYTYEDANFRTNAQIEADVSPTRPCAGVFIYHPEITTLLGAPKNTGEPSKP